METTLAVMERQQQFDFQKNGIEVMNFETLQRTYKENDIYFNGSYLKSPNQSA